MTMMADVIDLDQERARRHEDPGAGMLPPHDLDAEAAVISAVLHASALLAEIASWLMPEHMYSESHRRIYEATCELFRENPHGQIDIITVGQRLKARDRIAQVGGMSYITELLNSAPAVTRRSLRGYAAIVFDKWRQRQAIARMQTLVAEAYLGVADPQDYLDGAVRGIDAIARKRAGEPDETNAETLAQMIREMTSAEGHKVPGIPTGLPALDYRTGGLHPGRKTIITARTGRGKTSLALMFALGVATLGIGVHMVVMEETRKQILARLVCGLADIPSARWRDRDLSTDEWSRAAAAASSIAKLPIWIERIRRARPSQIRHAVMLRAEAAITTERKPLGLVIVDNLHEESPEQGWSRKKIDWLGEAARVTADLAEELHVPVVELAQMRDIDRGSKRPQRPARGCVADCPRDIEATAANIVGLWIPDGRKREEVEAEVFKVRDGGREGAVKLTFRNERFVERDAYQPYDKMQAQSRELVDQSPAAAAAPREDDVDAPYGGGT